MGGLRDLIPQRQIVRHQAPPTVIVTDETVPACETAILVLSISITPPPPDAVTLPYAKQTAPLV